jgi:hypothetical protein
MDITVGDCAPGNGDTNPARIPVEIVWRSAWRTGEFPFRVHGFTSNVHIGVSWDPARWPFAEMSVAAGGHGWSVGPNFTPSGRAGEAWAVDQARRKNLLPLQGVLPSTFMQELGPSKGLWVLENFYSNAPQGSWTATFSALHAAGPSSSNATFAMFDADGSMIEKTVDLACGA